MDPAFTHVLAPKIRVLTSEEKDVILKKYQVKEELLPLIEITDAGLVGLNVKPGEVVECLRKSPVTGKEEPYYRRVIGDEQA